jgi:hypothetical protein
MAKTKTATRKIPKRKPMAMRNVIEEKLTDRQQEKLWNHLNGYAGDEVLAYKDAPAFIRKTFELRGVTPTQVSTFYRNYGNSLKIIEAVQADQNIKITLEGLGDVEFTPLVRHAELLTTQLVSKSLAEEDTESLRDDLKALATIMGKVTAEKARKESVEKLKAEIQELKDVIAKGPEKGESAEAHKEKVMELVDQTMGLAGT